MTERKSLTSEAAASLAAEPPVAGDEAPHPAALWTASEEGQAVEVFRLMACLDGDSENLSKAELVAGQHGDFKIFEQIETDGDGLIQAHSRTPQDLQSHTEPKTRPEADPQSPQSSKGR